MRKSDWYFLANYHFHLQIMHPRKVTRIPSKEAQLTVSSTTTKQDACIFQTAQVPPALPLQVPEQAPADCAKQRAHKSRAAEFSGETFHAGRAKKTAPIRS